VTEKTESATDDLEVVIDLLEEDALLREAIREPLPVRLPTGKVISVPHIADWPHIASRFITVEAFDAWAARVLSDADYKAWQDADLHNYQVRRIVTAASAAGDTTPGKSSRSSTRRSSTRTK
jgi:hypothetical protein